MQQQDDVAVAEGPDPVKAKLARQIDKLKRQKTKRQLGQTPYAHAPRKTGSSAHWVSQARSAAEQLRAMERALRRIQTVDLIAHCPEFRLVSDRWSNVYLLRNAKTAELRAVRGLGPVGRRKIRDYLAEHNVQVSWEI